MDIIILVNIQVLSIHASHFSNQLAIHKIFIKDESSKNLLSMWKKIKHDYDELVVLAKEMNNVIGHSVTFFLLELLLTYVTMLDDEKVFVGPFPGWKVILAHIFYACLDVPTAVMWSGNVCSEVKFF